MRMRCVFVFYGTITECYFKYDFIEAKSTKNTNEMNAVVTGWSLTSKDGADILSF